MDNIDILRNYINSDLDRASKEGVAVSLLAFSIPSIAEISKKSFEAGAVSITMIDLEGIVRASLRRRADFVITVGSSIFTVLHETEKEEALIVAERIRNILADYIRTKTAGRSVKIEYAAASSAEGYGAFDSMLTSIK